MNTNFIKTLRDVENLLSQAACIEPSWTSKDECYHWIEFTLRHFKYRSLGKADKGDLARVFRTLFYAALASSCSYLKGAM